MLLWVSSLVCVICCGRDEVVQQCAQKKKQNRIISHRCSRGSFVLPFLLAVSLSFSTWELRRQACILGQATGSNSLLWLGLRLDCACPGNGGEMQTYYSVSGS